MQTPKSLKYLGEVAKIHFYRRHELNLALNRNCLPLPDQRCKSTTKLLTCAWLQRFTIFKWSTRDVFCNQWIRQRMYASISNSECGKSNLIFFVTRRMWLPPGQSSSAVLTCIIPPNTEIGAKDKITFTSQTQQSIESQAAILTVITPASQGLVKALQITLWEKNNQYLNFDRIDVRR